MARHGHGTRPIRVGRSAVAALLMMASCSGLGSESGSAGPPVAATIPAHPTTVPPPVPGCEPAEPAFRTGTVTATIGDPAGDAAQIAALAWKSQVGCERVTVAFETVAGAPAATIGATSVQLDGQRGIIRIVLPPEVATTAVADTLFDGDLLKRAFVVRKIDGGLVVDLHLGSSVPVEARAFVSRSPVTVTVDVRPAAEGGAVVLAAPIVAGKVVVLRPAPGPAQYPIVISGYARTLDGVVTARLVDGTVTVREATASAADWLEAWGEFVVTIEDGPEGDLKLFVGEESLGDEPAGGAEISVSLP